MAPVASAAPIAAATLQEFTELGEGRAAGLLVAGAESVRFQLRRAQAPAPRPMVVLVPILAGGDDLMESVAQRMCGHGFDVTFCARTGSALKPPQRSADLDELFRRTVLHQRILLGWLRSAPEPPTALFVLGLSMGGMVSVVVGALEPDLHGIAVCLSGGDLAGLVLTSSEQRVQSWVAWRRSTDGVGADHLQWELQHFLTHEPIPFAASIAPSKVLMVSAKFDSVVPHRHQDLLWEALGRPARLRVPLGHYSAALALDPILQAVATHFAAKLPQRPAAAP